MPEPTPLRSGELIRDRIPGASLHVAASAQHWKQNPDEFCALVASFIKAECPRSDDRFAGPANAEAPVRP